MPRLVPLFAALLFLAFVRPCSAQESPYAAGRDLPATVQTPMATVTQTPEMWFYEQERMRDDDPKMAIRRRAELKGQQRAERLASQKWYGINNSRPMVATMPTLGGTYSPYWGSNTYNQFRWKPFNPHTVIVPPTIVR